LSRKNRREGSYRIRKTILWGLKNAIGSGRAIVTVRIVWVSWASNVGKKYDRRRASREPERLLYSKGEVGEVRE